jgi:hypothetical protein
MHISERISQNLPSLSLSQTIVKLPEFNSQSMGMEHILPLGIQNNWGNQMVAENYQIQPNSSYIDNLKSSSSDYDRYVPNSMGSDFPSSRTECKNKRKKRNKKIISRREKSSDIIRKRESILPYKYNDFQVELHRPDRSKQKSKIEEGLSDSSTEMVKLDEKADFESKRIDSNLPSSSSLPSFDKEIKIQVHFNQDGQYSSDVQHQQKIRSNEFIPIVAEDMEIIRNKLLTIKSSPHSRKNKCGDRQAKQTRNERGLSPKRRSISDD